MVIDNIKNANLYYALGERFTKAFKFLQETNLFELEPGKYELDGQNVYVLVQSYNSKTMDIGKWEAHRRYADIQYVFDGVEKMGYTYIDRMKATSDYNEEKDIIFFEGEGNFLYADKGTFAIFLPEDIHMPGMAVAEPQPVKKVVVKVLV